jgi:hypothetical protein
MQIHFFLDEPKLIPPLPFNPYPLWYSTYYFIPLYRTWSQINSSQTSAHLLKKSSTQSNVLENDENNYTLHTDTSPICRTSHDVSVEESVTECAISSLGTKCFFQTRIVK